MLPKEPLSGLKHQVFEWDDKYEAKDLQFGEKDRVRMTFFKPLE